MGRPPRDTRQRILETAHGLFYQKGFARVSLDVVAETTGVTKRTLYYHFTSKDELLAAVLEFQHGLTAARIAEWGERLPDDVEAMLDELFAELARWAAKPRFEGTGFTRLVMELADRPGHPARAIARRHKAAIETWLAEQFAARGVAEAKLRAREVKLLLEGCVALMLIHNDRAYARAAAQAAKTLVANRPGGKRRARAVGPRASRPPLRR
ncbi:transcriptional regulator, TetR family [Rhizobiales bacterium GAS188]|nr:transcriptional regulator, TetR family [Rhizobiales bacterium GAS188]